MEYKKIGDLNVSRLAFGCWAIGGHGWGDVSDKDSITAIKLALDMGVNFFDTADVYGFGHSEEVLSKALGEKRHDVVIATKFGVCWDEQANISRNNSSAYIVKALEDSLLRLRVDCIPLYQIHWPDSNTPIEETMLTLMECKKQGKIQNIGCSNFSYTQLNKAMDYGNIVSLQSPYSLLDRGIENRVPGDCVKNSISLITYGALVKGLLSGKFNKNSKFTVNDIRSRDSNFLGEKFVRNLEFCEIVDNMAYKYNKTSAQVALRWVLDTTGVTAAIAGIKSAHQIQDNIGALDWNLLPEDYHLLSALVDNSSGRLGVNES